MLPLLKQNRFDCSPNETRIRDQPTDQLSHSPSDINRANPGDQPREDQRRKRQNEALRSSQCDCAARNLGSAICGMESALISSNHASKKGLDSSDDRDRSVWRLVEHQPPRTAYRASTSANQQEAMGGYSLLRGVLCLARILTHPDPDRLFATASTILPNPYPPIRPTVAVPWSTTTSTPILPGQ